MCDTESLMLVLSIPKTENPLAAILSKINIVQYGVNSPCTSVFFKVNIGEWTPQNDMGGDS